MIPLMDAACEILITQFKKKLATVSNPSFTEYIKELSRRVGITEMVKFSYKKGTMIIDVTRPKFQSVT